MRCLCSLECDKLRKDGFRSSQCYSSSSLCESVHLDEEKTEKTNKVHTTLCILIHSTFSCIHLKPFLCSPEMQFNHSAYVINRTTLRGLHEYKQDFYFNYYQTKAWYSHTGSLILHRPLVAFHMKYVQYSTHSSVQSN